MRLARLAVMGDDYGPVSLEPKANNPGERRVDDPKPHPFPALHGYAAGNLAVDRDRVADAPRHTRFHAISEAGCDASVVVESPILDKPQEIAVNGNRFGFFYNQCARQSAPKLLERVGVRVIPERAPIWRCELVGKALAGSDRVLSEAGHPIHRIRHANTVPVNSCGFVELVFDQNSDRLALANPDFRA